MEKDIKINENIKKYILELVDFMNESIDKGIIKVRMDDGVIVFENAELTDDVKEMLNNMETND